MGTLHATLILLFVFTIFLLLMLFFVYDILNIAKHYHGWQTVTWKPRKITRAIPRLSYFQRARKVFT